ncbi:MAG: glycosyltransferase family 2 protein [Bryobacteraceae bacterium]
MASDLRAGTVNPSITMPDSEERPTYHLLQARTPPALLSIVMPMYNEEGLVKALRPEMERFIGEVPGEVEVILVNDGSTDKTLDDIMAWASEDRRIKIIHLSRNFGHQVAATAGLDYAKGDAVVLIDADLQDPLNVIHEMIARYCEGYDVVYGQRTTRQGESAFKLITAWIFYRLMRALVYKRLPVDTGDFRLMSRECLDGFQQMRETHRFLRGMVAWVGYPQCAVKYQRAARATGTTKYPLRKMWAFAWTAATSFSTLPLQASIFLGFLTGLIGLEEGIRALMAWLLGWYIVPGWTSLTVLTCVIGSSLLLSLGIVGQYIGRIYEEIKERPLYLVSRTYNLAPSLNQKQIISRQTLETNFERRA